MADPVVGNCNSLTTKTFTASGTANGPTQSQALDRARMQAQTILDAYVASQPACPNACPSVDVETEPDYDAQAPVYTIADPTLPLVVTCTIQMARVVNIACSADTASSVTYTPGSVDFGDQKTGQASAPTTITIANGGPQNLVITAAQPNGPFTLAGLTLPLTVAPGASATFTVTFTPTTAGEATGMIGFTGNDPSSPGISLQGNGT